VVAKKIRSRIPTVASKKGREEKSQVSDKGVRKKGNFYRRIRTGLD